MVIFLDCGVWVYLFVFWIDEVFEWGKGFIGEVAVCRISLFGRSMEKW